MSSATWSEKDEINISLLGFGNVYSRRLADFLIKDGYVVDLYSNTHAGSIFRGVTIQATADFLPRVVRTAVIVCPFSEGTAIEIRNFVECFTTAAAQIYTIESFILEKRLPPRLIGFPTPTVLDAYRSIDAISVFGDRDSAKTLLAMCRYWSNGDRGLLQDIRRPISGIYFDSEIIPDFDRHIYVDAGAFTGDSFRAFSTRFDHFDKAILFEPNMNAELASLASPDVTVMHCALGKTAGSLKIGSDALQMSPCFENSGHVETSIETLEDSVEALTYLKIDCEGYDLDVMEGGRGLISECRPTVALCVYHDAMHLLEGIQFFEDIGGYRLFLRKYSNDPAELILYGIPA